MTDSSNIFSSDTSFQMLRDSARGFLAQKWPADHAVAFSRDPEKLRSLWREMAQQGWLELGADLESGGMRFASIVLEELGRAACPAPLLDAFLANLLISKSPNGGGAFAELASQLRSGTSIVSCVLGPSDGDENAGSVSLKAGRLQGAAAFVEGAQLATHFLVVTDTTPEIAVVPTGAAEIVINETPGYSVPPLSEVEFNGAAVDVAPRSMNDLRAIRSLARLGLASRALGAATRGFEIAVAYAKERVQFGKKIGQYQAIQHKLANCLISLDTSRLAIWRAAASFDRSDPDFLYTSGAAISVAGPMLRQVCLESHHAFGGVSFWEEHEMPRHFRRIHADLARCGGVHGARQDVADYLLEAQ